MLIFNLRYYPVVDLYYTCHWEIYNGAAGEHPRSANASKNVAWNKFPCHCKMLSFFALFTNLFVQGSGLSLDQTEQDVTERTDHVNDSTARDMELKTGS